MALLGAVTAPDLHVMTLNVRRRLRWTPRRSDRWSARAPLVRALLAAERPDLLAAQEVLPDQAAHLGAALGDGYRRVGYGREVGRRGEATPLFYDSARLELLAWAQRALSDRPDDAGSRTWGNPIPRVFVEAVLRDRETHAEFFVIATHFDVFSARARHASAAAVRERIAAQSRPAVVLGDLNDGPASTTVRTLVGSGSLTDAWIAARERLTPEWGTYGGYRRPRRGRRIDHILTSPEIDVRSIGIRARPASGPWPSDHFPVQAVLRMPAAVPE